MYGNIDFTGMVALMYAGVISTPILIVWIAVTAWGYFTDTPEDWQRSAIQAGVAERVMVDPETGETEFRWKECECE